MIILKEFKPNTYHLADALLKDQLKRGENVGHELIFEKFPLELLRYGKAIKTNRSYVMDCNQEKFIDLGKSKYSLKETDKLTLYLFKSVSNKIFQEDSRENKRCEEDIISYGSVLLESEKVFKGLLKISRKA